MVHWSPLSIISMRRKLKGCSNYFKLYDKTNSTYILFIWIYNIPWISFIYQLQNGMLKDIYIEIQMFELTNFIVLNAIINTSKKSNSTSIRWEKRRKEQSHIGKILRLPSYFTYCHLYLSNTLQHPAWFLLNFTSCAFFPLLSLISIFSL